MKWPSCKGSFGQLRGSSSCSARMWGLGLTTRPCLNGGRLETSFPKRFDSAARFKLKRAMTQAPAKVVLCRTSGSYVSTVACGGSPRCLSQGQGAQSKTSQVCHPAHFEGLRGRYLASTWLGCAFSLKGLPLASLDFKKCFDMVSPAVALGALAQSGCFPRSFASQSFVARTSVFPASYSSGNRSRDFGLQENRRKGVLVAPRPSDGDICFLGPAQGFSFGCCCEPSSAPTAEHGTGIGLAMAAKLGVSGASARAKCVCLAHALCQDLRTAVAANFLKP